MKLGDFITLQRGFDLPIQDRRPGSTPIISSSGISDYHDEWKAKAPGVVTGRYGTIGEVFYTRQDYWPLNTTLWVKDFHGNDPHFSYYLLKTVDFLSCSDKSSVPGVNRNDLHLITVIVPPLAEQRIIASILSSLDDKIELNRKMNETLEAMARAIYKSWFVDFDPVHAKAAGKKPFGMDKETAVMFPDSFEDSAMGKIPKGWKVDSIKNRVSRIQYGLTESASKEPVGPRFLRITDIQGGKVDWNQVPFCHIDEESIEKYKIVEGDICVARTGASTGENIFIVNPPNAVFASYLVRFQCDNIATSRYVAQFMRSPDYFSYVAGCLGGSAQPNANAQTLASAQMAFPIDALITKWYELVIHLDKLISVNSVTASSLAATRDCLLPRLLSGELQIKDVEKTAKALV